MRQKFRFLVALSLMLSLACYTSIKASSNSEKEAKAAAKVKSALTKLGTGPDARVEIKLRDKTKLKGYVSELGDDHFMLVQDKTGTATQVAYPQVQKVKGKNRLTGETVVAIVVVVALLAIIGGLTIAHGGDF
jgi:hypothetical protein